MQFSVEEVDKVQVITCSGVLDVREPEAAQALDSNIKTWLLSPSDVHVIDCKGVQDIKQSVYRYLVLFNQQLKSYSKHLYFMNINPRLLTQLRADGLISVVVPVQSVEEARRRSTPNRAVVDVEFINPFIMATKTVLETQAQLPLNPGKAYLRKATERIPMEIAGVIGIQCADFVGTISICFRAEVFLNIYEKMVGEKHEQISSEIEDAAGELLNIIYGQAKTVLNDRKGFNLEKSLPTILVGEKLKLHHQSRNPSIVIPFESAAGAFHLEVLIDRPS